MPFQHNDQTFMVKNDSKIILLTINSLSIINFDSGMVQLIQMYDAGGKNIYTIKCKFIVIIHHSLHCYMAKTNGFLKLRYNLQSHSPVWF